MERKKQREKGFTLIELLVVIVILSMLATVSVPRLYKAIARSKKDLAKTKLSVIEQAIERFATDCGRLPADSELLEELITVPEDLDESKWEGPYLKRSQLLDSWGNPVLYREVGEINPGHFDLISFGADGEEGGEGDAADIFND